jgi:pimeloyl-ACP methyl ester carboxylesterase
MWMTLSLAFALVVMGCGGDDGGMAMDGSGPDAGAVGDGDGDGDGDGQGDAGSVAATSLPRAMDPIEAPVADDCITDVSAGDHTFTCGGLTFLVMVNPLCTEYACGLILDVHGATMAGAQMRDNTLLHELAPPEGFLVVHPSATASNTGGVWSAAAYPAVEDFMGRMIDAFHVDEDRVHFTGFSQGGQMSWHFVCNFSDVLASAAPVAATPSCVDESWSPRIPLLYMQGITDGAFSIESSRAMIEDLKGVLELSGEGESVGDGNYDWRRWEGADGVSLDYIEHDYGGQAVLAGHCIPGGIDTPGAANNFGLNATTCTTGEIDLNWGEVVLQWFLDHPRR